MTANRIHPFDNVLVRLYLDGKETATYRETGLHNVETAIRNAYKATEAPENIEDYVFGVTDLTGNTSARYRVDAGGKVRLIPEEKNSCR